MAVRQKQFGEAIARFDRAVRLEDAMTYTEPPDWHAPVRHSLGAALLEAVGRPKPRWSIGTTSGATVKTAGRSPGLHRALLDQGRKDEAAAIEARLKKAWAKADVARRLRF